MNKYTRKIYRKIGGGNGSSSESSKSSKSSNSLKRTISSANRLNTKYSSSPSSSPSSKKPKSATSLSKKSIRFSPRTYKGNITKVDEQELNSPEKLYKSLRNMDIYDAASKAGLTTSPVKTSMLPMAPSSQRFTPKELFKPLRGGKMRKSKKSKKSKKSTRSNKRFSKTTKKMKRRKH